VARIGGAHQGQGLLMTAAYSLPSTATRESSSRFFDELRATEYARLDKDDQAYLDYTGSGLYAERQITSHSRRLRGCVLGNPHSENGPSLHSTALINETRTKLLRFLDASPQEYAVIFVANTSAAIKLVAESFPFDGETPLVLSADNHNSMNGVREFARAKGAAVRYIPLDEELRLQGARALLVGSRSPNGGLFGFPAQSNFSGVKHPLALINDAHRLGYMVLLDAAAFLPTNRISLSRYHPDFLALSIYKITGYPTGVGALVARRESLKKLRRPWFAGGTVEYASVQHGTHLLADRVEGFEDGTPAFIDIAAVADGLSLLEEIGVDRISAHVARHAARFMSELSMMRRRDDSKLVRIYGPLDSVNRGATIAFNVISRTGNVVPFARVVERARNEGVSLRGGCFCNPGASEAAFDFPKDATRMCLQEAARSGFTIDKFSACVGPAIPVGAVRASMGIATNERDVDRALAIVASFD
jgi:selenocysteine lyase/cysteine desulfurase